MIVGKHPDNDSLILEFAEAATVCKNNNNSLCLFIYIAINEKNITEHIAYSFIIMNLDTKTSTPGSAKGDYSSPNKCIPKVFHSFRWQFWMKKMSRMCFLQSYSLANSLPDPFRKYCSKCKRSEMMKVSRISAVIVESVFFLTKISIRFTITTLTLHVSRNA